MVFSEIGFYDKVVLLTVELYVTGYMLKVYTKTGDSGQTSLLGAGRVSKDCIIMQVVGALDELNAALGVAAATLSSDCHAELVSASFNSSVNGKTLKQVQGDVTIVIQKIQRDLFKLGAEVAALQGSAAEKYQLIGQAEIIGLEKSIDTMWEQLPELKNFILPGGHPVAAQLHLARAICRRAERELVGFGRQAKLRPAVYQYLNRLSDWLFASARYVNFKTGQEEIKV